MIRSGIALTDTILHQTGQTGQYIDRRVYPLSMQLHDQNDLPFCNITGQVGDRVCDIIVGMVRIGICVTEPSIPSTIPARS